MDYSLENHRKMENPGKTWLENDGFSWDLEWDLPSLVSSVTWLAISWENHRKTWLENDGLIWFNGILWDLPSGNDCTNITIWKVAIEIVDVTIQNGDFP